MQAYKWIFLLPIISILHFGSRKIDDNTPNYGLSISGSDRKVAEYEVNLTHTGYVAFSGTLQDCPIRSNGKVVLTGFLKGEETVDAADDIIYRGTLQISIDMDICSAKRLANGEDKLCGMTVKGSGPVRAELTIYSDGQDSARGAYVKFGYDSTLGIFSRSVVGNCDHKEMVEEEKMVPNETIAAIFNGRELPMLTERKLRPGQFIERDGLHVTVVDVLRKIR
ncbi:MAG TPA: hypothetical protein VFP97_01895 [Chitinophagaceae bacterium]|nr:hypothetical protein [Chitinophagaceae bacterium]